MGPGVRTLVDGSAEAAHLHHTLAAGEDKGTTARGYGKIIPGGRRGRGGGGGLQPGMGVALSETAVQHEVGSRAPLFLAFL